MDPNKIFSQNSAFLQQYQADLSKQTSQENVSRHISLLTGKTAQLRNASGTSLLKTSQEGPLVSGAGTSRPQLTQVIKKPQGMTIVKKSPATRVVVGGKATSVTRPAPVNPYYKRWKRLKRVMKDLMFMNASVCDEVIHVEEKIAKAKEERRCLLRKLLHYESLKDGFPPSGKASPADSGSKTQVTAMETNPEPAIIKSKSKKKSTGGGDKKKMGTVPTVSKEIIGTLKVLHL